MKSGVRIALHALLLAAMFLVLAFVGSATVALIFDRFLGASLPLFRDQLVLLVALVLVEELVRAQLAIWWRHRVSLGVFVTAGVLVGLAERGLNAFGYLDLPAFRLAAALAISAAPVLMHAANSALMISATSGATRWPIALGVAVGLHLTVNLLASSAFELSAALLVVGWAIIFAAAVGTLVYIVRQHRTGGDRAPRRP